MLIVRWTSLDILKQVGKVYVTESTIDPWNGKFSPILRKLIRIDPSPMPKSTPFKIEYERN